MKLSIVIPVYNEEKTIKEILNRVVKQKIALKKEIVIVNDGSTDKSKILINEFIKSHPRQDIRFFEQPKNMGKGAAVVKGLKEAKGHILLIQDADLEYDPKEYPKLLEPILKNQTKVVYGSRLLGHHIDMYLLHKIGNDFLTLVTNFLFGSKISDMETGYKVFRKEVIQGMDLKAKSFDFEPEITAKILKRGYKIKEVRIRFDNARTFEEGKKINVFDGVKAVYYLFKYRFFD